MKKDIKVSPLQVGILAFFLSQVFFFPIVSSFLFKNSKQDIWISLLIGFVVGICLILLFLKLQGKMKGMDILSYNTYKFGKILGNIFNFVLSLVVLFIIVLIFSKLCIFLNINYLNEIPIFIIGICFLLVSIYAVKRGLEAICRTSQILAIISIVTFILAFSLLIYYIDFSNIKPIFETSITNIFKSSLLYSIFSIVPLFLILIIPKNNITYTKSYSKSIIISYIISFIMTFIILVTTVLVLGGNLITIFEYPEYIALKQIQFFHFVERLENIFSIIWIFNVFVVITLGIYFINEFFKKISKQNEKANNFVLVLLALVIVLFSSFFIYIF